MFCLNVCLRTTCAPGDQRGQKRISCCGTEARDGLEPPRGRWGSNPGPLQEQSVSWPLSGLCSHNYFSPLHILHVCPSVMWEITDFLSVFLPYPLSVVHQHEIRREPEGWRDSSVVTLLVALPRAPSLVPSTIIRWFTCNSSTRGSDTLLWPLWADTCTQVCGRAHTHPCAL